jgi:uncharacterized protein YoxC
MTESEKEEVLSKMNITKEQWNSFVKAFKKVFDAVKQVVKELADLFKKNRETIHHQTKWELIRDTRLKSQVIDNKPKHLVKRVNM